MINENDDHDGDVSGVDYEDDDQVCQIFSDPHYREITYSW